MVPHEGIDHDAEYEETHVHQVYEQIASHFSATRFKPWPLVERFLKEQPDGAIGLDVGCGNGKHLTLNKNIFIVGSDRSANLVAIASQHRPHAALMADTLHLPHRPFFFDFAISIAVIHHLSTRERRVEAIKCVLGVLRRPGGKPDAAGGGRALFYVWALEQRGSRRGWDHGDEQDIIVPWVMKQDSRDGVVPTTKTFQRYYHLYQKGELDEDISRAGGTVVNSGYERDNWWAIAMLPSSSIP